MTRGKHVVMMHSPKTAASEWRPLADRVYATPTLAFASSVAAPEQNDVHDPSEKHRTSTRATGERNKTPRRESSIVPASFVSALAQPLPVNVQIITLQSLSEREVLLRLAHQFGVNEDVILSHPASVDLATLFNDAVFRVQVLFLFKLASALLLRYFCAASALRARDQQAT